MGREPRRQGAPPHLMTRLDSDHTSDELDCWCCPLYYDETGAELTREQAEASWNVVIIVHRSERKGVNDVTNDIPWQ